MTQRDYSGSSSDRYAQFLQTLFANLQEGLFPILEKAEKEGKILSLAKRARNAEEYSVEDVILS